MAEDHREDHREDQVLIPLKSGQLLWHAAMAQLVEGSGLNPFEIRATALAKKSERASAIAECLNPFEIRATALAKKVADMPSHEGS